MIANGITSVAQRYENKCRFSTGAFVFTVAKTRTIVIPNTKDTAKLDANSIIWGILALKAK